MHVLDLAPLDGSDPERNFEVIERELAEHDPRLAALPRLLALSKADLVSGRGRFGRGFGVARARRLPCARDLFGDSAWAWVSCAASCCRACRWPRTAPEGAGEDEVAEFAVFRPASSQAFDISRGPDGTWIVIGDSVDRLIARWDLENEEAQALVESRLRRMGVIGALERAGFEPGDDVEIGGIVFELDPS